MSGLIEVAVKEDCVALLEGSAGSAASLPKPPNPLHPVLTSAGPVRFAGPLLINSQRAHDPISGPLPIASDAPDLADRRTEITCAGPDVDDVLDVLIEHAAGLLDAPARLAEPVDGHLVWTRAFGDDEAELGSAVDSFDTLSGAAWRSGIVQYTAPGISTACCGEPASAIAVPVVHVREPAAGRHASSGCEVFALVVLTADHPGWFDRADVRSMLSLAAAAADRIAQIHADDGFDADDVDADDADDADDDADEQLDLETAGFVGPVAPDDTIEDADDAHQPGLRLVSVPVDDLPGTALDSEDDATDGSSTDGSGIRFDDAPRGRRAASLGHHAVIQRPEVNESNGFGGWFTPHEVDDVTPSADADLTIDVDELEQAVPVTSRIRFRDSAELQSLAPFESGADFEDTVDLVGRMDHRPLLNLRDRSGLEDGADFNGSVDLSGHIDFDDEPEATHAEPIDSEPIDSEPIDSEPMYPVPTPDMAPITPRKPLIVAQLLRQAGRTGQPVENPEPPRLMPVKEKVTRPATPGLQAPKAPTWYEIDPVAAHPVPQQVPRKPVHLPLADPELPDSGPEVAETAEVIEATETAAAIESADAIESAEPVDVQPIVIDLSKPAPSNAPSSPANIPSSAFFQLPVPSATPPSVTPVSSRERRPNMQPISTLPPSMPAPETMGLWQWDARTGECTWSSPVGRLIGGDPDAPLTLAGIREAIAPLDRERFDVAVQAIMSGRGVAGAIRLTSPAGDQDGDTRTAYAWSEVRRDELGALLGAWGGVVDLTAFELDSAQLRNGLTAQRAAQELAGLATWQWWPERQELVWSDEMYRLLGVSAESFAPTLEGWHAFVHPDDAPRARMLDLDSAAGMAQQDQGDGKERVETFRLIGSGGEIRHVQSWAALNDEGAEPVVYGATIDVTRQVQDRVLLEHLSVTDPVTGLGNRIAYDRRISELLAQPASAVTLMLLDLDRFKVVNDSLGHQVGDRLLIEVARRLVAVVPDGSVTARMGGDEFVVVPPPGATVDDAARLAASIVDALRAPYVLPETGEMLVSPASIGIAMSARRQVTGHDLLREADIALYQAKSSGRDRFVVFDDELRQRTHVRARAERRLREALQDGRLVMEYQPVVDFVNGRLAGAEGLVRLHDGDEADQTARLIPPDLFMDIAEQTGLVVEVDCWVIEAAIAQLAQWSAHSEHGVAETGDPGELPWLAINISARSMEHPRVVRRLIEATKRGEVGRGRLKIELTEQSFIGNLPGVEAALRQLTATGIEVGIDDFGTGYSALAYLQNFDLDFMKIDRSFVASVGENPRSDAVVTAIVDLAHAHGMTVIAEGVETSRQARRLREIGCDFAQGYHFGRPGAPSRITVR